MPMTLSRSVLTILIPGLIAICPWLLVIAPNPPAMGVFDKYGTLASALVFCAATVAGSIFERWGAWLESRWDKEREAEHNVKENWIKYLCHQVDKEPVAFRYLSRLKTSLYLELGMLFAAPLFFVGSGEIFRTAWCYSPSTASGAAVTASGAAVGAAIYFYTQARDTHLLLCTTRAEVNARLKTREQPHNSLSD